MTDNIFAPLLAGVPRINPYSQETSALLYEDEVLAALAAAYPADLAEAEKVLEGVTPGPWRKSGASVNTKPDESAVAVCVSMGTRSREEAEANARFIAWCREGVPALLARIAAMEAQIKGLDAERDEKTDRLAAEMQLYADWRARAEAAETALAAMTKERDGLLTTWAESRERHLTAETALAAERAKVAKLVEAVDAFPADWRERAHSFKGMLKLQAAWADGFNAARAAITEASQ